MSVGGPLGQAMALEWRRFAFEDQFVRYGVGKMVQRVKGSKSNYCKHRQLAKTEGVGCREGLAVSGGAGYDTWRGRFGFLRA